MCVCVCVYIYIYIYTHIQVLEKERSKYESTSGRRKDVSLRHLEDEDKDNVWFLLQPTESLKHAVLIGVFSSVPLHSCAERSQPAKVLLVSGTFETLGLT